MNAGMSGAPFDRYWRLRCRLSERHGERCRIIARGSMNSIQIEFESDRVRHIVSRFAVRRLQPEPVHGRG